MFGLLLLDKPLGLSSNRALQRAKPLFAAGKAGHAGSLAPELDVENVQPVGAGNARDDLAHLLSDVAKASHAVEMPLKRKKWAQAHFGPTVRVRSQNYSTYIRRSDGP